MPTHEAVPSEREPKDFVLEAFLAFVRRFADVGKIRIATMGGAGREAALWQRARILGANGWLIERARALARRLLSSGVPYRVTNSLAQLSRVFRAVYGPGVGIDAFHLDLCGTFEAQTPAFRPVLPLILGGGEVRCLAVTVADMRRNTSLEDFRDVWYRSFRLIGAKHAQRFLAALKAEQRTLPRSEHAAPHQARFDPEKSARREFALFVELGELLREEGYVPELVERYVYVSHASGWPFRMRTFMFRFVPEKADARQRLHILAERWLASSLSFVTETGMVPVRSPGQTAPEEEKKEVEGMKQGKLEALVALASPEVRTEFQALVAKAADGEEAEKRAAAVEQAFTDLQARIHAAMDETVRAGWPMHPSAQPVVTPTTPKRPAATGKKVALNKKVAAKTAVSKKPAKKTAAEERAIGAQLTMLRGAAKGAKALERAKTQARDLLGLKKKSWRPTIGSLYARTQGKFRPNFVGRAIEGLDEVQSKALLEELAGLYSKITGTPVSVADIWNGVFQNS